jgi:hypothetical protein
MRTYSELIKFPTFKERFEYLKLNGCVGQDTFGYDRYLNQEFYHSPKWRRIKREIIIRDEGRDLGVDGYEIQGRIYIHHMNPVTKEDILNQTANLCSPEFLICVSKRTHDAIHFGDERSIAQNQFVERRPNDTCPWKH